MSRDGEGFVGGGMSAGAGSGGPVGRAASGRPCDDAGQRRAPRVVRVEASRSYDVVIGRGLLDEAGERARRAAGGALDGTCLVVSDDNVGPLYAGRVRDALSRAGLSPSYLELPAGEPTKCMDGFARVVGAAADAGLTRAGLVVALGGGVVGDLAGFAAASYMRGCHLVQLATSLLAMVDSSVGGKTAIDLPQGKNLVGAFYQPDLVLCDLDALGTLPPEFISDGTGEVVKYGVMGDPELFDWLSGPLPGQWERVVERCVSIKRDVVQADEREAGERKRLNLGHTVGHAIEKLSGFSVPHGHAVAAGTSIMARACASLGLCAADVPGRIDDVLRAHGLPTGCRYAAADLYEAALSDKKRVGDSVDVVLIHAIGFTEVRRVGLDGLRDLIERGVAEDGGSL
ncbi:MAG: 3-dehydroquinate synthase [Coriobacteriales bacterium]